MDPHVIELNDQCEIFQSEDLVDYSYSDFFSKHDHLILIMKDQMFEGDVVDLGHNSLDLINTREHGNPNQLRGIYFFYRNEIKEIRRTKTIKEHKPDTCINFDIQLSTEYQEYQEMTRNYLFIDKFDETYKQAIFTLKQFQTLGIVVLGCEDISLGTGLLVISTWEEVYLFDLTTLEDNNFYPEIEQILSNELICKVLHRGGPQIYVLQKLYNVSVTNVFDIEIFDLIIEKNKAEKAELKTNDISECLIKYFDFPPTTLRDALKTKNSRWLTRPLSNVRKLYAAELGVYLIMLKEKMEKIMFCEVQKSIDDVCQYYNNLNDFDFAKYFNMTVSQDIDKLIPVLSRCGIDSNDVAESWIGTLEPTKEKVDKKSQEASDFLKICKRREYYEKLRRKHSKNKKEQKEEKIPLTGNKKFFKERDEAIEKEWGYYK